MRKNCEENVGNNYFESKESVIRCKITLVILVENGKINRFATLIGITQTMHRETRETIDSCNRNYASAKPRKTRADKMIPENYVG